MNSLTDLREVVDVVIGVDTHVHTHSAAVVDAATGGVLGEITVRRHPRAMPSWWSSPTTTRAAGLGDRGNRRPRRRPEPSPAGASEIVIELDRPKRAARRNGAKSDPLDAIRAAREAMARPRLGTPAAGGERQALSVLFGCSPLRDQCLHRGPAAGLQPGHRRPRTHPCPVPRPEARRDAQHRREAAGARPLGHRDDQHCRAARPWPARARDAEGGTGAAEGDRGHHPRLAP